MKNMNGKTRVLHLIMGKEAQFGACEIYRDTMPMHYLGEQSGWYTQWAFYETLAAEAEIVGNAVWEHLLSFDMVVFPRAQVLDEAARAGVAMLFGILREKGIRIVYEVDDDYTNQFRQVTHGDAITALQWADALTVTTPFLAERMRQYTKQPIHILPNCIDPAVWRDEPLKLEVTEGKIVIGLTGSPTHVEDWRVLESVMPDVLAKHPNVHFILMGYHPPYLSNLQNTSYVAGTGYNTYSQIIRGCDIILAPVDPNDGFNLGKSPIKAIEGQAARRYLPGGQAAGAAVIATSNPVYQLAIKHNDTGMLTEHTPQGWSDALNRLIVDKPLRERLQISGHKAVYKRYDISNEYAQWARAYRKILSAPQSSVKIPLYKEFTP